MGLRQHPAWQVFRAKYTAVTVAAGTDWHRDDTWPTVLEGLDDPLTWIFT